METILIVDDEPDLELLLRQKFRRAIRAGTYEFVFAHDGVEALEVLDQRKEISIVFSDINMPRMDGLTLLKRLSEEQSFKMSCVVVSAYGDMSNIRSAMNYGAYDFLTKPINFEDLETTIDKTVRYIGKLREYESSQQQLANLQRDLDIASVMQESVLPVSFPDSPLYEIHAGMLPAKAVSGDFYFCQQLDETGLLALGVADVSGKGVPAALFMMVAHTLMKGISLSERDAKKAIQELNKSLCLENETSMFVTLWFGIYNPDTAELTGVNAGHSAPILVRQDGSHKLIEIETVYPPLGVLPTEMEDMKVILEPGDLIFIYTDGFSEAFNKEKEMYGDERVVERLKEARDLPIEEVYPYMLKGIQEFSEDVEQSDDITGLVIRRTK